MASEVYGSDANDDRARNRAKKAGERGLEALREHLRPRMNELMEKLPREFPLFFKSQFQVRYAWLLSARNAKGVVEGSVSTGEEVVSGTTAVSDRGDLATGRPSSRSRDYRIHVVHSREVIP